MITTILILAANPIETDRLDIDAEQRAIEQMHRESAKRDVFVVKSAPAAQWEDLQRELMAIKPRIVHYIGHGDEGLMMAQEGGGVQAVTGDRLAEMFRLFPFVDCVVLNACHTEGQANAIHEHVRCVVGMSQKMGDVSAREFAAGFYAAVFAGDPYARAFDLGKLGIASGFDRIKPMLLIREAVVVAIDLEPPGSRMSIDSPFYIDRPPIEVNACREILRPGALIRIKGPREFGKSSLMARMAAGATGARTIEINFREIGPESLGSLKRFLQYFCNVVTMSLDIEGELDELWAEKLGYKAACGLYFEKNILPQITESLVLELDEVDVLLGAQVDRAWVVDFFSMLRAWYDSKMKSHPQWKKLRLVLVHSKEIDRETLNQRQSPFNVGMEFELREFEPAQVVALAQCHGVEEPIAQELMKFVGGHPQLVRMGLYEIAQGQSSLDEILNHGATGSGLYKRHLEQLRSRIEQDSLLGRALQKVLASGENGVLLDLQNKAILRSFGVVVCQDDDVRIACELYRKYFSGLGL
jgi:hypothetical protein